MASYLQAPDYSVYNTTPFVSPTENINRAFMYKQQQYDTGVARIQGQINDMLNLDITNVENKERMYDFMEGAKKQIQSLAGADFSQLDNVNAANNIFRPITQDKYILNDIATTKHFRKQVQVAEDLRSKNKGEGFSSDNLRYVTNAWNKFVASTGDSQLSVEKREYSPYVDVMAEINKTADLMGVGVTIDSQYPGGYILRNKNGDLIAGALKDVFNSNLSSQARNQLNIEATVGFEDSERILGEQKASEVVIDQFTRQLNHERNEYNNLLGIKNNQIKDIEALGSNATIQQIEQLQAARNQKSVIEDRINAIGREFKNMTEWNPDNLPRYALEISKSLYTQRKAHDWAESYAKATRSLELKTDEPYWKHLELTLRARELQAKIAKDGKGSDDDQPVQPLILGPDSAGNVESSFNYDMLLTERNNAANQLSKLKADYQDQYWDTKAEGNVGTYSTIQKAINNGQDIVTLDSLARSYNSDNDLSNDINLEAYARALGVPLEQAQNMTVRQIYDKMENTFSDYVRESEAIPNGDINVYNFKSQIASAEDYFKYWDNASKRAINSAISEIITRPDRMESFDKIFKNRGITRNVFLDSSGNILSRDEAAENMYSAFIRQGGIPSLGDINLLKKYGNFVVSDPTSVKEVIIAAAKAEYDSFLKPLKSKLDEAAKSIADVTQYPRFGVANINKDTRDTSDIIAAKALFNLQFEEMAQSNFPKKEEYDKLKRLQGDVNSLVAGVEYTNRPGGKNTYIVRFRANELKQVLDKDADNDLINKLLEEGFRVDNIQNIPELAVQMDYSRFLLENNTPVERNFSKDYNFKIFKVNSPQGPKYMLKAKALEPLTDSQGNLVVGEQGIQFVPKTYEIEVGKTGFIEDDVKKYTDGFSLGNAAYVFSQLPTTIARFNKNAPGSILTKQQLTQAAAAHFKMAQ